VAAELGRRFGDEARVVYLKADDQDVRAQNDALITEIETRGLLYPVTVVDGVPLYDGAVSYPAIMRAVGNKLAEREGAQA
jgi:disulfide oxidoreductase YuzD